MELFDRSAASEQLKDSVYVIVLELAYIAVQLIVSEAVDGSMNLS